jgi:hypothetical protein
MEVTGPSEMLLITYKTTRCHNPKDHSPNKAFTTVIKEPNTFPIQFSLIREKKFRNKIKTEPMSRKELLVVS